MEGADDEGASGAASEPVGREPADPVVARERALALLEATHQFPCAYELTVIAFNREPTTLAVKDAVAGEGGDLEHKVVESRAGKYLSHRFSVRVAAATEVLEIHARVRVVDGVVTIL